MLNENKTPINGENKPNESKINWFKKVIKENTLIDSIKNKFSKIKMLKDKKVWDEFTEYELYKRLSFDDKKKYIQHVEHKNKIIVWIVIMLVTVWISYWLVQKFNSMFASAIEHNIELMEKSDKLKSDIKKLSYSSKIIKEEFKWKKNFWIEELLQRVTLNWKMAKLIFDNRDEVLSALFTIESLIPKDYAFTLSWIKRSGVDSYNISAAITVEWKYKDSKGNEKERTKNSVIREIAKSLSAFNSSKEIMAIKRLQNEELQLFLKERDKMVLNLWRELTRAEESDLKNRLKKPDEERKKIIAEYTKIVPYFTVDKFTWTTYSKNNNSFPINITVSFHRENDWTAVEEDNKK